MKIRDITLTPVAFRDPPLLNAVGVHEPWALRTIIEVHTDEGVNGLGETYGDAAHLERLHRVVPELIGLDVYALNALRERVVATVSGTTGGDAHGLTGTITAEGTINRTVSPFETALLDIQARAVGRPVADLLGGAVRDAVPFSAYLFYKWAQHPGSEVPPDYPADPWGEALDPAGIVEQARRMIDLYGFGSLKLKGGVFPPEQEIEAIEALHDAFPGRPLRLDPNCAWSERTSVAVGQRTEGLLEYLEDPTADIPAMARVAREVPMPLATNMCVVAFEDVAPAVALGAVGVILADHHYWGGLTASRRLAQTCDTFGIGLSMHSNSHLGISLAAMTQLAAATPNLTYACDTHWPWQEEDVLAPGSLRFVDGAVELPEGPGLGVELDRDALAVLHEQYERCGVRSRDDASYRARVEPGYQRKRPRF